MSNVVPIDIKLRQKVADLLNSVPPSILLLIAKEVDKQTKRQQTPGA